MNYLIRLSVSILLAACFFISNAFALENTHVEEYENLQNCLAEASNVQDNGSYETYCIEAYELAIKTKKEYKTLNSKATDIK